MKKSDVSSGIVKENMGYKKRMILESSNAVNSSNNVIQEIIKKMKQIDMKLSFLI